MLEPEGGNCEVAATTVRIEALAFAKGRAMNLPTQQINPERDEEQSGGWAQRRAAMSIRIEVAALELFVERGVENITVEEIASAAGISRRTFYRYFETPLDVLTAMPRRSLQRVWQDTQARPPHEHAIDALLNALRAAQLSETDLYVQRLSSRVMRDSSETWWRAQARMQPSTVDLYRDIIAERLRASQQSTAAAGVLAATIISILNQVLRESQDIEAVTIDGVEKAFRTLSNALRDSVVVD